MSNFFFSTLQLLLPSVSRLIYKKKRLKVEKCQQGFGLYDSHVTRTNECMFQTLLAPSKASNPPSIYSIPELEPVERANLGSPPAFGRTEQEDGITNVGSALSVLDDHNQTDGWNQQQTRFYIYFYFSKGFIGKGFPLSLPPPTGVWPIDSPQSNRESCGVAIELIRVCARTLQHKRAVHGLFSKELLAIEHSIGPSAREFHRGQDKFFIFIFSFSVVLFSSSGLLYQLDT